MWYNNYIISQVFFMGINLNKKTMTGISIVVIFGIMNFLIIIISTKAFQDNIDKIQVEQEMQFGLIRGAVGGDISVNNTDNWNIYKNDDYKFLLKYPESVDLKEIKYNNGDNLGDRQNEYEKRVLSLFFGAFSVQVWENPNELDLGKYLISENVCAADGFSCADSSGIGKTKIEKINISGKEWLQPEKWSQSYFVPTPENGYYLDFKLLNLKHRNKFNKILSTLEFF